MPIDSETLAQLRAAHGEVRVLTSGDTQIVVRRPTRAEYKRFRATIGNDRKGPEAAEQLLLDVAVQPDRAGMDRLLDQLPGLAEEFADPLLEMVGLTGKALAEKR